MIDTVGTEKKKEKSASEEILLGSFEVVIILVYSSICWEKNKNENDSLTYLFLLWEKNENDNNTFSEKSKNIGQFCNIF